MHDVGFGSVRSEGELVERIQAMWNERCLTDPHFGTDSPWASPSKIKLVGLVRTGGWEEGG